jgi:hypothetical protein
LRGKLRSAPPRRKTAGGTAPFIAPADRSRKRRDGTAQSRDGRRESRRCGCGDRSANPPRSTTGSSARSRRYRRRAVNRVRPRGGRAGHPRSPRTAPIRAACWRAVPRAACRAQRDDISHSRFFDCSRQLPLGEARPPRNRAVTDIEQHLDPGVGQGRDHVAQQRLLVADRIEKVHNLPPLALLSV